MGVRDLYFGQCILDADLDALAILAAKEIDAPLTSGKRSLARSRALNLTKINNKTERNCKNKDRPRVGGGWFEPYIFARKSRDARKPTRIKSQTISQTPCDNHHQHGMRKNQK